MPRSPPWWPSTSRDLLGRALGGTFTFIQAGKATRVDIVAVTVMSAGPLAIGLALTAWLSSRWPVLITPAKIVATVLAISTFGAMTIPAGFDTTSTLCLAARHLVLAAAAVLALDALPARPVRSDVTATARSKAWLTAG